MKKREKNWEKETKSGKGGKQGIKVKNWRKQGKFCKHGNENCQILGLGGER